MSDHFRNVRNSMNDHFTETRNMVSDTAMTDDAEYKSFIEPITCLGSADAEFARLLECHLNAQNELISKLSAITNDLERLAAVRLAYIQHLETENDALRADLLLWGPKP